MFVTLVSASEKKARIQTRRIASRYLFQIGHDVWHGQISDEGLNDLISELKAKRSRFMSVIVWRNKGRSDAEIVARLGNMDCFDDHGFFVHKTRRIAQPYTISNNPVLKAMSLIVEMAALFHDLGKATDGFQEKLRLVFDEKKKFRKDLVSDPVRHELVSVFIVAKIMEHIENHGWGDLKTESGVRKWFLDNIQDSVGCKKDEYLRLKHALETRDQNDTLKESTAPRPFDLKKFESDNLSASLLWLVLTHHKMPDVSAQKTEERKSRRKNAAVQEKISISSTVKGYVNTHIFTRLDPFFEIKNVHCEGHPWNSEQWCQRVARIAERLETYRHCIPKVNFLEPSAWITALMYMARPALVFADHRASSRKEASFSDPKTQVIVANTVSYKDQPYLADRLADHLTKTDFEAARYFNVLFRKEKDRLKQLERIQPEEISKDLKSNKAPAPYDWQNELGNAAEETEGRPTLAFIMAETGTGKTRGCIKLAHELSPKGLRCTVGLGLRTLADQTYQDYLQFPINLPKEKVGRMIGSYYPVKEPIEASIGTGASEDLGETVFTVDPSEEWIKVPTAEIFDGKKARLFTKSVTSMTIDNIIQAVGVRSGVDSHILMHLMHSDLIVDEIDNFSPADLSFVVALVHIMAFYGRKVILATATINEVIVRAMCEAYEVGIKKRKALINTADPKVIFVKSQAPFYKVEDLSNQSHETYKAFIAHTTSLVINKRHKTELLECVQHKAKKNQVYQSILDRVSEYSRQHQSEENDQTYSAGFVRFNTVKRAQDFSVWLTRHCDLPDTHVEVVCYHSKTTAFERYIQEYFLNHMMKRKGQDLPSDVQAARSAFFERARKAGKANAVLVVVTTNIIEVGRDHDYDWCILEPSSLSSFIQSIGRVLRHRKDHETQTPNISVLNAPMKVIDSQERIWAYPGIETPDIAAGEGLNEGFYRLMDYPEAPILKRSQALGIGVMTHKKSESVQETEKLLGNALIAPSNKWALSTPDYYEQLPEHALNLIRLNDYLRKDGVPANKKNRRSINAGNIAHYSGFQIAQALGTQVKFRASTGQVQLTCKTNDASYGNPWVSDLEGHDMHVSLIQGLSEDRFFLSHIDRDRFVQQYIRRFRPGPDNQRGIQSQLFQVTLYKNDTQDLNFSRHLGMCRSDVLEHDDE